MAHKDGKLAKEILALQKEDGTWGSFFHSLAQPNNKAPLSTEQALRRLKILGFTIEDEPIRRAVDCMMASLRGERRIDDYWEKTLDWELFTQMMLATWIRMFQPENELALCVAKRFARVLEGAFEGGSYSREAYLSAYWAEFSERPKVHKVIEFENFYLMNLLQGVLSEQTEKALLDYMLSNPRGIYYIYDKPLNQLPKVFASKETSRYLGAIEILAGYRHAGKKLGFVADWLESNRGEDGQWDLGVKAKDNVYFPLSDSWRSEVDRRADCTERIEGILQKIRL